MSKLAILDSCRALGSALLVSLVVGCMDGHSPTTPSRLSPTTVGVSLQVSASRSAAARSLRVVASYARVATPSVLRGIDSVTVPLSVGDTQVPVQIDMATCLQDSDRELPFGVLLAQAGSTCVLHLKLTLLDDAGSVIDEAALAPITARLGEQATTPARELGPRPLPTNAISVGQTFSCVLNEAGAAYCWGSNKFGQFGTGDTVSSTVPRASGGGLRFSQIVVGSTNTCGLTLSGAAYCWGSRASGTLGNGSTAPSKVPIAVEGGLQFQSISAGIAATCGIRTGTGEGYCWGSNSQGTLGTGDTISTSAPRLVSGGLKFKSIRVGLSHACGLVDGGTSAVSCWGWNVFKQINTTTSPTIVTPVAVVLPPGANIVGVIAGGVQSCALAVDGSAYCWGSNFFGAIGGGTTAGTQQSPSLVVGGLNLSGITTAKENNTHDGSCGWTSAGAGYCWGINDAGQLGSAGAGGACNEGTTTFSCSGAPLRVGGTAAFVAIASGGQHTCALTRDHTVLCWGLNSDGQLGNGTLTNTFTPTLVSGGLRTP